MSRTDRWLSRAAAISVAAAAAALVWRVATPSVGTPTAFVVGDHFDAVAGFNPANARMTVVLWLDSHCVFCIESMPFYRSLEHGASSQVVVMGMEPVETLRGFAARNSLVVDSIVTAPNLASVLAATPQVIAVDSSGRIRGIWTGLLPAGGKEEQEIRALL